MRPARPADRSLAPRGRVHVHRAKGLRSTLMVGDPSSDAGGPGHESRHERPDPSAEPETAAQRTGPLQVVVVDDEPPIRVLVRMLLQRAEGLDLIAETAGVSDAVEAVRRHQPEVVLVDLELPGSGGREVISRSVEAAPDAMVLVMSALNADVEAEGAFEAGAFAYIEKSRLGPGLAADVAQLYDLFERAREGEDVWADDVPRVWR